MAFGMKNLPTTFQNLMHLVLGDVPKCNVYLDDVVVYSDTWREHLASLAVVFSNLAEASLMLNLAKCEFGKTTVTYLGKQVGNGQVRRVDAKVSVVSLLFAVRSISFKGWLVIIDIFVRISLWWFLL